MGMRDGLVALVLGDRPLEQAREETVLRGGAQLLVKLPEILAGKDDVVFRREV
jgi:hypothetical protein